SLTAACGPLPLGGDAGAEPVHVQTGDESVVTPLSGAGSEEDGAGSTSRRQPKNEAAAIQLRKRISCCPFRQGRDASMRPQQFSCGNEDRARSTDGEVV